MKQLIENLIINAEKSGIVFDLHAINPAALVLMSINEFEAMYHQPYGAELIAFNPKYILADFESVYFAKILFHELGHATGHASRLNRIGVSTQITNASRWPEELIAERIAQMSISYLGLDCPMTRRHTLGYIALASYLVQMSEIEAYSLEKQAREGFEYIMNNWIDNKDIIRKVG